MNHKLHLSDRRLDILILGPMADKIGLPADGLVIKQAVEQVFAQPKIKELMVNNTINNLAIHLPDEDEGSEIIQSVFSKLDIADLVIINLSFKNGRPSPNVYYEVALVHAMGLPHIMVMHENDQPAFYLQGNRIKKVKAFKVDELESVLEPAINRFLSPDDTTNFADNRLTQFYQGLPLVDVSAASGLATGYFENFLSRLISEGGFMAYHSATYRKVVVVRPHNVFANFAEEKEALKKILNEAGLPLKEKVFLDEPPHEHFGSATVDMVGDIIVDLPRTIYPLKLSPKIITLQKRNRTAHDHQQISYLAAQASEHLLDNVFSTIDFLIDISSGRVRKSALHVASFDNVVETLITLRNTK